MKVLEDRDKEIADLKARCSEIESWARLAVDHERKRSDNMLNLVLAKTTGMVIEQPRPNEPDALQTYMGSILGSDEVSREEDAKLARQLEELQK